MPDERQPADEPARGDITELLSAARAGDRAAMDRLFETVYRELKQIARRLLRGRSPGATLETTALVHEAYFRLARQEAPDLQDRVHFFAVAARAMRQIVIDHARARQAAKRGGGQVPVDLEVAEVSIAARPEAELIAIDAALTELEALDARLGRVVELRFYGGLTFEEIGTALGLTDRTIKRDWRKARAFLGARLNAGPGSDASPAAR